VRPRPVQIRNANITRPCSSRANIADGTSSGQVLSNVHLLIERNGRIRDDRSIHIGRIAERATQAAIETTSGIAAGDGGHQGGHGRVAATLGDRLRPPIERFFSSENANLMKLVRLRSFSFSFTSRPTRSSIPPGRGERSVAVAATGGAVATGAVAVGETG
jgi:hypothetical protein